MREPLLHFVLGGGLLFAIDHVLVGRADDPRTIVVGAEVDREAIETFKATRGRDPNREELAALRRVWLDNEVLYREGLAQQVDKGDPAIRERVIFKALSVIDSNVKLPPATDEMLRKWFDGHRDKYDEPARFDFEEAALSGDSSEAAVRAFVKELNGGTPGDAKAGLRVFKGRPHVEHRAELRAGAGQGAGGVQAGRVARPADARRLAGDAARTRARRRSRRRSRSCAAWCCTTGPTPPPRSSAPPPCARWPRSTRSSTSCPTRTTACE